MSKQKRTIALDFDGVLHAYNGWQDGKINPPIDGARHAVESLLAAGNEVVVFSTRDHDTIVGWLARYDFPPLEVTNVKRPFYVLVDDRAVRFNGEWTADVLREIQRFEPYWIQARRGG